MIIYRPQDLTPRGRLSSGNMERVLLFLRVYVNNLTYTIRDKS